MLRVIRRKCLVGTDSFYPHITEPTKSTLSRRSPLLSSMLCISSMSLPTHRFSILHKIICTGASFKKQGTMLCFPCCSTVALPTRRFTLLCKVITQKKCASVCVSGGDGIGVGKTLTLKSSLRAIYRAIQHKGKPGGRRSRMMRDRLQ